MTYKSTKTNQMNFKRALEQRQVVTERSVSAHVEVSFTFLGKVT